MPTYPSVNETELRLFAGHAYTGFCIRNPYCRMISRGFLAALHEKVADAFVDVCHPFLLLRCCGGVDGKGFPPRANQPAVSELAFVF